MVGHGVSPSEPRPAWHAAHAAPGHGPVGPVAYQRIHVSNVAPGAYRLTASGAGMR